jgi:hypothetical protein
MAEHRQIESDDPQAAREEIERIRARMSGTLDEIEENLVRKKEQIREALDVGSHIRRKPLHAAGAVLVAALLLGFLSAGGQKEARIRKKYAKRVLHWENRARRLLAIAREQEAEIDRLEDQPAFPAVAPSSADHDSESDDSDIDLWDDEEDDYEDADDSWDDEWQDEEVSDGDSDDDSDPEAYGGSWSRGSGYGRFLAVDREASPRRSGISALRRAVTDKVARFAAETARSLLQEVRKRG